MGVGGMNVMVLVDVFSIMSNVLVCLVWLVLMCCMVSVWCLLFF